jgi:hypothetical protein
LSTVAAMVKRVHCTRSPAYDPTGLNRAFVPRARIAGDIMWNGRKNAVIGLSALFAFVLLELSAAIAAIGAVLELAVGIDVPVLPFLTSND